MPICRCWLDRPLVEGVGLAGQLDLAVERLVGDAQQRAVGHAEAIALGGDGRRFHVDRDRARLVEAQRQVVKRSSQLRSSVVTTVPVRRRCFRAASVAGDFAHAPAPAPAGLRRWRDRDLERQHVVEHMVVAQIGVGEDVVADRLACAQAAAMADHQPHFGPQHREMVADRLGVGRADADVDQGDALRHSPARGDRPASAASWPAAGADGSLPLSGRGCRARRSARRGPRRLP